ncbi:MAG: C39 family peptidase [Candidatus Omnitrophota bacterium]|nr:C39 family peptidase [Candidatus Omnitrophota bacterium]
MDWLRDLQILPQPDDTTCGPTCLHAIYDYYGDEIPIKQVIEEVSSLKEGGTLAVMLGCHALKRGYRAKIYTYNLQVFDPAWFQTKTDISSRLSKQLKHKRSRKLRASTNAYLEFLKLGGKVLFEDLTATLIRKYLYRSVPILTGLSSTYLYHSTRERVADCTADDIRGEPTGHFVILCGYEKEKRIVLVADPYKNNPLSNKQLYPVQASRLIGAILLGILTYDANLLIIEKPGKVKK